MLKSPEPEIVAELEKLGSKSVPALIRATKDKDDFTRWEAVNMLGQLKYPRSMKAVLGVVLRDNDVHARWRAIWALSRFEPDQVKPLLIKALKNQSKKIKWNAAVALSIFGDNKARSYLLKGLKSEDNWQRWEAFCFCSCFSLPRHPCPILGFPFPDPKARSCMSTRL